MREHPSIGMPREATTVSFYDQWDLKHVIASDFLVRQLKPWLIEVWEPLRTKAPNPNLALAYCCYIRTVIFYVRPYQTREWHHLYRWKDGWEADKPGSALEEWDRADSQLSWDTILEWNGERFKTGGGTVFWSRKRWWMKHWARRVNAIS